MEAALERDHGRAGLVYERANLIAFSTASVPALKNAAFAFSIGSELAEALGEADVDLVGDDREIGVAEALELLLGGFDDARVRVADVQAADAAGEIDERVAVDVGEPRALAPLDHDRKVERERVGDNALLPLDDLAGAGAGNLGAEVDRLGRRHARRR